MSKSTYKPLLKSAFVILIVVFALPSNLNAQSEDVVTCVEEDWELLVTEAEPSLSAPQLVMVMMPQKSAPDLLFSFHINHATLPDESMGGLQVQAWSSPTQNWYKVQLGTDKLSWNTELVHWTQRMSVEPDYLRFAVRNFKSSSFGSYDSSSSLRMGMLSKLTDLNGYQWEDSISNSGVSFAENRVHHLKLKKVRLFGEQGLIREIIVDQIVDSE